ncbi:molybdate ABC transporter substrate-binding protein [Geminicoccus flavidas]|uniref:molybdate ABC transporter substrate-binding protein n=1 Tax=Geminicoccus flavidas TaxID=2506407 RepID=UPI00135C8CB9|nr:molybdate ABC transporter substrate-binding protein [Geminicoccus flavidas]
MLRRRHLAGAVLALGLLLPLGAHAAERLTVFAAASLKNALDEAITAFGAASGTEVVASYAASSALAKQIEAGAPADLFISADIPWMDYLAERDLIEPASRVDLLGNTLVLVAPADSDVAVTGIGADTDFAALLGDGRLAVGQVDSVPAGKYAKAALEKLGVWPAVEAKLAQSDNVRAALALVSQGEAPLGIVYGSDAASDPKVKVVGTFPKGSHPPIIYPAALVKADPARSEAAAFLAFLQGDEAAAAFRRAGFTVLDGAAS